MAVAGHYSSPAASVAAGALTSSTRACQDRSLQLHKYKLPFQRRFQLSRLHEYGLVTMAAPSPPS